MKRRILTLGLLIIAFSFGVAGCGKKQENEDTIQIPASGAGEFSEELNVNFNDGKVISQLTGQLVDKNVANNRIITCMINNIKDAMPQSGISKADIVYECVVEGGITRLMGVFQNYKNIEKLGPVRSARHYYVDFSQEYDAVYTHVGQTSYAVDEIEALGTEELSGLTALGNIIFWRDNTRVAPHNCYTDGKKMVTGMKKSDFDRKNTLTENRFDFHLDDTELSDNAKKAERVNLTFNAYSHPYFEYNKKDKTYYRWQYDTKHIDDQNGKQLHYKNIIVQFTPYSDRDSHGYQDVHLLGKGEGYYITDGKYIPITWEKNSMSDFTTYYDGLGSELKVNPGKTWISIFPTKDKDGCTIK